MRLHAPSARVASLETQVRAAEEAAEVVQRPSAREALWEAVARKAQETERSAKLQALLGEVEALQVRIERCPAERRSGTVGFRSGFCARGPDCNPTPRAFVSGAGASARGNAKGARTPGA